MTSDTDTDVLVIGGGPVGMFVSFELHAHGIRSLVYETQAEPDPRLRARVLNAQTVALLDRRDLLGDLKPSEPKTIQHFAGMERADLSRVDTDHPYGLFARQQTLETLLETRLHDLGIPPLRRTTVAAVRQSEFGIEADVEEQDGRVSTVTARYAVACDGGRSSVRRAFGIPFDGSAPTVVAYQGLVDLETPEPYAEGWHRNERGTFVIGPGRRVMIIDFGDQPDLQVDQDDVERAFQESLSRVVGTGARATGVDSMTRFTDNARVARRYRDRNIFLAGDSAHVQPPFAGQGLNMGIQDAANLGWKLGDVLNGFAPETLLDTYESERRPVAIDTVKFAVGQSALFRTDPQTEALRHTVSRILDDPAGNKVIAGFIAGVGVRYGSATDEYVGTYARDEPLVLDDGSPTSLVREQRERPEAHLLVLGGRTSGSSPASALPNCNTARTPPESPAADLVRLVRPDGFYSACAAEPGDIRGPHDRLLAEANSS
jgi:2-polyprenyl-6-methoxyphenol hydroxylase-like FAD-dependent oxidoreductase